MITLVVIAGIFAVYALVASRLERWSVSAPIVFLLAGVLCGPAVLGWLPNSPSNEFTRLLAELTLAVLLFADASTISLRKAEGDAGLPTRLLIIGLPLTMALGIAVALLVFPSVGLAMAALIAMILAPTDAALGLAVVENRAVPARIRRALNIESGLNDGIATPFVMLALAAVVGHGAEAHFLVAALKEIGIALVLATALGAGSGWLLRAARKAGWTSGISEDIAIVALSLLSYSASVSLHGNGFVAAFVAGLFLGAVTRHELVEATKFTETVGLFASFAVWVLFGVDFAGPAMTHPAAAPILYALLSLTVVRMLPVAVALVGKGLKPLTIGFMGWFGPRGLASAVFTLIAFDAMHEAYMVPDLVVDAAAWTILLSVILHGLSSGPFAAGYGRRAKQQPETFREELTEVEESRIRRRSLASD